jgi:hypothetical protein
MFGPDFWFMTVLFVVASALFVFFLLQYNRIRKRFRDSDIILAAACFDLPPGKYYCQGFPSGAPPAAPLASPDVSFPNGMTSDGFPMVPGEMDPLRSGALDTGGDV